MAYILRTNIPPNPPNIKKENNYNIYKIFNDRFSCKPRRKNSESNPRQTYCAYCRRLGHVESR